MNIKAKKGFTLVELLIVIAVLAILIAAVIIVLNPGEILAQARDSQRLSDISTLTSVMQLYIVQPPVGGIDLGSCPAGGRCTFNPGTGNGPFTGNCDSASGTVRTVDGKGWMDVNFTSMSTGAPLPALPTDPTNNTTYFYGYACTKSANTFEFTSRLESAKYRDKMKTDAGVKSTCDTTYTNNTCFYEVGSSLGMSAIVAPSGLSYPSPNNFVYSAITPLSPTVSGAPTSYSILPPLPAGLFINPSSGQITGTPTASSTTATYTVTASNIGGSTTFGISIAVLDYGTVSLGGHTWLDRNLGAKQVATSSTDYQAYGSLFQWGRGPDGHQLITCSSGTACTAVNSSTTTLSSIDSPLHSLFITNSTDSADWRSPQNDALWQNSSSANNPCPSGFHVPTSTEWTDAVNASPTITKASDAFSSVLRLPAAGYRRYTGFLFNQGIDGRYWSSSASSTNALYLTFDASTVYPANLNLRANGFPVRCAKD